jgi:glycosyltransferase involved in cell wall biosynthesis
MPSFEEPFGVVFLEAMAMKKPVIALDSGGVGQVVDHRRSGLLSQPHDIDQLAANIVTLIEDAALRQTMGDYARSRLEQYFTPERMAHDMEEVYHRVLEYRRGKRRIEQACSA